MPNSKKPMRRLIFLFTTLLLFSVASYGQDDHLEPAKDLTKYQGQLKGYYDGIFNLLLDGLSEKPLARYLVLPSFSAEYILSVEKDSSENFKIVVHCCSENFWYSKDKSSVKVKKYDKLIDKNFALSIKKLFDKVTGQIKPTDELSLHADGTTYYFSTTSDTEELITGEKWSPIKGSKMDKLVQVCEDLILFALNRIDNKNVIIDKINTFDTDIDTP